MATFELTTNAGQRYQIDADTPDAAQKAFDSQFGGPKPLVPSATPDQASFLPLRRGATGPEFDPTAGALGSLMRALSTPGDVARGAVPTPYETGNPNPDLTRRAIETAGLISPPNPAVASGDFAIPGVATNLTTSRVAAPSATALQQAAGAGYDAARASGVDVNSSEISNGARGVLGDIRTRFVPADAPSTYSHLDEMLNPTRSTTSIAELLARRDGLSATVGKGGPDGAAALQARNALDDVINNLTPSNTRASPGITPTMAPEDISATLQDARGNYRAALGANRLSGDLDPATRGILEQVEGRAAVTGNQNVDTQIRSRAAALLERNKEVRGYTPDEIQALEEIRDGTVPRNILRNIGRRFGGSDPFSMAVTGGLGSLAGYGAGGTSRAALLTAGGLAAGGWASKALANRLAKASLGRADELVRSNSPLYQGLLNTTPANYVPGLTGLQTGLHSLWPGLLTPPPAQPGFT